MAACCLAGIGLLYLGAAWHSRIVVAIAIVLQIPFWLWAIPSLAFMCIVSVTAEAVMVAWYFGYNSGKPNPAPTAESDDGQSE
jgi:TRAP-type C4-dicarboxylate transport system permease small subunit